MQPIHSFVTEVEQAIATHESTKRMAVLRQITSLFIDHAPLLTDDHVAVYDEVIVRLAREIEFQARVELADRMADIPNAPLQTISDLALDEDIAVAGPVLRRSARISDDDLMKVAETRGQLHLRAVAARDQLGERITDILVDRGDSDVHHIVAGNAGARLSDAGYRKLAETAAQDGTLLALLRQRGEDETTLNAIITAASERAAQKLAEAGITERGTAGLTAILDREAERLAARDNSFDFIDAIEKAMPQAQALLGKNQLDEEALIMRLQRSQVPEALAGLALMAGAPPLIVARAFDAPQFDPLLFLVRSARLNWPCFKAFLVAKSDRDLPEALLRSAFSSFDELTVPTAQRVIRFVCARAKIDEGDETRAGANDA